jgi:DNA repair exonuclease SbcCD ATPase subunit
MESYKCPDCRKSSAHETKAGKDQNKKTTKSELKKKAQENDELRKEMKELQEKHEKELDLRQTSLDSLSSQNIKFKRTNEQQMQAADVSNKKIVELEKKNKALSEENAAHIDFVKTSLRLDIAEEFEKLKKLNIELEETLKTKEVQIIELRKATPPDDSNKQKLSAAKKTNEQLIARIGALETSINEQQDSNSAMKLQLQVTTANYEREHSSTTS